MKLQLTTLFCVILFISSCDNTEPVFKVVSIEQFREVESQLVYTNSIDSLELLEYGIKTSERFQASGTSLIFIVYVNDTTTEQRPILEDIKTVSHSENWIAVYRNNNREPEIDMVVGK